MYFILRDVVNFRSCAIIDLPDYVEDELPQHCIEYPGGNMIVIARDDLQCPAISNLTYDLRVIVLTYDRPSSLLKILQSLTQLEVDGDSVLLEIWIDRSKEDKLDAKTFNHARSFRWNLGPVHIHVQQKHAGIIGQWIDSWKPKLKARSPASNLSSDFDSDGYEVGLILEDDLSVSPHAYRWLKAARHHFRKRKDLAGITLQSEGLIVAENGRAFDPNPLYTGPSFLYKLVGSWGFAPDPVNWSKFQTWFRKKDGAMKPYVSNILMTSWYKKFEKKRISDTMWTMWFIYFCHINKFYTVYSNLVDRDQMHKLSTDTRLASVRNAPTIRSRKKLYDRVCLVLNRREPGLHFSSKVTLNHSCIDWKWNPDYALFREEQAIFDYNGKPLKSGT